MKKLISTTVAIMLIIFGFVALAETASASETSSPSTSATTPPKSTSKIVVPLSPTVKLGECGTAGDIIFPIVEGVKYSYLMDSGMGKTTIRATPLDGYALMYADRQIEPHVDFQVQFVTGACPTTSPSPVTTVTPEPTPTPTPTPTFVDVAVGPPADPSLKPTPTVTEKAVDPLTTPLVSSTSSPTVKETTTPVIESIPSTTPVAVTVPTQTELAYTGFSLTAAILGVVLLFLGIIFMVFSKRRRAHF